LGDPLRPARDFTSVCTAERGEVLPELPITESWSELKFEVPLLPIWRSI
jgi:hypothetical protein